MMKKILNLVLLSQINIFMAQESSYQEHRYSGLQAYPNPFSKKYPRINKLEKSLRKEKDKFGKDVISIALFAATLDALSEGKLSDFKDLLEKESYRKKTIHHRIDFLIAQALWEDKFARNGHSNLTQSNNNESRESSFFYKDLKSDLIKLCRLRSHNPLQYIGELLHLLKIHETQNIDTRAKCFTAVTYMLSPVKIEDIKP
jgi:hypothetical protein